MAVAIGTLTFDGLLGSGPSLPRAKPITYTRPGSPSVGARIQPSIGMETEIRVVRYMAEASRLPTQNSYQSIVGTVVGFIDGGTAYESTYGINFLVLDVTIEESRAIPRVVGIDPSGVSIDHTPGGRVVSKWRLLAVPA